LVQGDKAALRKVDQATVKDLELRAPRASTLDAKALRSQVLGEEISVPNRSNGSNLAFRFDLFDKERRKFDLFNLI